MLLFGRLPQRVGSSKILLGYGTKSLSLVLLFLLLGHPDNPQPPPGHQVHIPDNCVADEFLLAPLEMVGGVFDFCGGGAL